MLWMVHNHRLPDEALCGKPEERLGKLTGDRSQQAKGKAKQVQGSAQQGLGNVQDAVRRP